jgi:hypothetical protein
MYKNVTKELTEPIYLDERINFKRFSNDIKHLRYVRYGDGLLDTPSIFITEENQLKELSSMLRYEILFF